MGQSGYTAGRLEGDPALQFEARNSAFPERAEEHTIEDADDERFTGGGGRPWVPTLEEEADWPPKAIIKANPLAE